MHKFRETNPALLLTVLGIPLSLVLYVVRKHNLDFHTRDYQYHLNVFRDAGNILTIGLQPLLLSPDGRNILGFSGVDAFPNSGDSIHFSPIVYLVAIIFRYMGELAIVGLYSIISSFCIYKFARLIPVEKSTQGLISILFIALLPFFTFFMNYDLRLYTIFISLVIYLIVIVQEDGSEINILFVLSILTLCREEAYYFAIICACHLYARRRHMFSVSVFTLSLIYVLLLFWYFSEYTDFQFRPGFDTVAFLGLPVAIYFAFVLLSSRSKFLGQRLTVFNKDLSKKDEQLLVSYIWLNIYFIPIWVRGIELLRVSSLFDRYFIMTFSIVVGSAITLHLFPNKKPLRRALLVIAATLFVIGAGRTVAKVASYDWERSRAIWQLRGEAGHETLIVTGLAFHQAFWDRNAVVWQRLPAVSVDDSGRYWPANRERLREFVEKANVFVLEASGVEVIGGLGGRDLECRQVSTVYVCQ